jgi:hypothetical protein
MSLIVNPKNKQQEKVVKAFLSILNIGFHSEAEDDAALANLRMRLLSSFVFWAEKKFTNTSLKKPSNSMAF